MRATTAICTALGAASLASGMAIDQKRDEYSFSCGCEGQSDANVADCQAAIDAIDTEAKTIDPMKALDTKKVGLWSTVHIMYESGDCIIGAATHQQPPMPGGGGGSLYGTSIDGQGFKDLAQKMLDDCQDSGKGLVNSCASVGTGNVVVSKK